MSAFDLDDVRQLLPEYLGRQRWFAGDVPEKVEIDQDEQLHERLLWTLVNADGRLYQVVVGACASSAPPDFLHGQDSAILGTSNDVLLYDATLDPELNRALLEIVAPGEDTRRVRPMGAEQSNTSVVFDDRLVMKLFRRVHEGSNPDVEVTAALGATGFSHVAVPVGVWRRDDRDLAVAQPYLQGATDGWALAQTSLRDLYASDCDDPAECGGDFAAEAKRLGEVTATMHLALADAFGSAAEDAPRAAEVMQSQLARIAAGHRWRERAAKRFQAYAALTDAGQSIRVHGDYHLGQVVRTDSGWFVLDFEGEPARPVEERRLPASPLKDVAGMLRSFDYASAVALRERDPMDQERLAAVGDAWRRHNRRAFLDGYFGVAGIAALLPGNTTTALSAWELDKAVYEIGYELAHRPDWVGIPQAAVERILED